MICLQAWAFSFIPYRSWFLSAAVFIGGYSDREHARPGQSGAGFPSLLLSLFSILSNSSINARLFVPLDP
jgi:hypothetical protein